jgi:putative addiction module CopG family antidote
MTYPPDVKRFVEGAIASGEYSSEEDLVVSAVRVLQELTARHDALRRDIAAGLAQADAGESQPLDMRAIKATLQAEWQSKHAN